ncbi:MAG: hypothetical protein ABIH49_03375 [archaeon]
MSKRVLNLPVLVLSVFSIIALGLLFSFIYLSVNGNDYTNVYLEKIQSGEIKNPIKSLGLILSEEEVSEEYQVIELEGGKKIIIKSQNVGELSITDIEKASIEYASVLLKFYNLHNVPFTSITPKIQIYIDDNPYYAEVIGGEIIVEGGESESADVIIRTTNEEMFKMNDDETYARESFSSGASQFEKVANDFILFSKGYLSLYNEFS